MDIIVVYSDSLTHTLTLVNVVTARFEVVFGSTETSQCLECLISGVHERGSLKLRPCTRTQERGGRISVEHGIAAK